jgi:3'-phosphoadenosine 5'-phosphosulfate sulfotransferase (PAPS reductase)/FAD synthetase
MEKAKHVIGISGGKDSAALAIYLFEKYPHLDMTYYFCDTGKELDDTYRLIENIENYIGKKIIRLQNDEVAKTNENPFDYFLKSYRGYLPSPTARWCTKKLKLDPFENFVGDAPTISYVGIRGDEDREGYISTKKNIQSIFPFRKNIWAEDVINKVLYNGNISMISDLYASHLNGRQLDKVIDIVHTPFDVDSKDKNITKRNRRIKLEQLLDLGVIPFNKVVFDFLKTTEYPLATEEDFPMLENDDVLIREDIFKILRESGVGVPEYYEKKPYQVEEKTGEYARSRSGCYFCFFQQKIEWIWLYEQHPSLFMQAMEYENAEEGFTWNQHETLADLIEPKRTEQIKKEHLNRMNRAKSKDSKFLIDILDDTESEGCAACFI